MELTKSDHASKKVRNEDQQINQTLKLNLVKLMKNYQIHFTQSFEETLTFQGNDEEEAKEALLAEWGSGEVEIHSIEEAN